MEEIAARQTRTIKLKKSMRVEIINSRINESFSRFRNDEERTNFINMPINQKKLSKGEKNHNRRIFQEMKFNQPNKKVKQDEVMDKSCLGKGWIEKKDHINIERVDSRGFSSLSSD
jgi:hypothetical protein